jgi:ribosome-binding ATPase
MNLSVGIVGLPNVGKSTLFNALLKKQQALAANYPFATIEPNIGIVPVPDSRLNELAHITKNEEKMTEYPPIKSATVQFVDIAGLVKGASEGAGLGNKFLSHIREVSIIAHVVRAFEDPDVFREGSMTPEADYKTIQTELILADLDTLVRADQEKKIEPVKKEAVVKLIKELNAGKRAFDADLTAEERDAVQDLHLLTNKAEIIVLNVSEGQYTKLNIPIEEEAFSQALGIPQDKFVTICAKVESELAALSDDEARDYLHELGLDTSGLERLIQKAYHTLGLISFLTAGEKEIRAWTIKNGSDAQHAAGEIHTDFIKKFIKAEVISYADYVAAGGRKKAREVGKARLEGKDYVVQDGDVIEFKIGA